MIYKEIIFENRRLYKTYPRQHELKFLSTENLKIILKNARIMINQAYKYNNIDSINDICNEIDTIYRIYSPKNNSAQKHLELFQAFLLKTIRDKNTKANINYLKR